MKKLSFLMMIFMLAFVSPAFAHTGLESSTPENGSTVTEALTDLTLTFETNIEQTSSFEIKKDSGESIPVTDISVDGKMMTGNVTAPLENGNYEVDWSIIGVDGHPMKGSFSFQVDASVVTPPTDESKGDQELVESQTPEQQKEKAVEENASDLESTEEDKGMPSYLMPVIILILLVVIGGSFWLMRRKK